MYNSVYKFSKIQFITIYYYYLLIYLLFILIGNRIFNIF